MILTAKSLIEPSRAWQVIEIATKTIENKNVKKNYSIFNQKMLRYSIAPQQKMKKNCITEAAVLAVKEIDDTATMPDQPHLAESLTEALKQLKEGSNLLEEQFQGDDLGGMFSNLGLDDVCRQFNQFLFNLIHLSLLSSLRY